MNDEHGEVLAWTRLVDGRVVALVRLAQRDERVLAVHDGPVDVSVGLDVRVARTEGPPRWSPAGP